MFTLVEEQSYYFGNCENCESKCCSGIGGSTFSQIIFEDFEKVYKNFPILFIFGNLNYIKPVILLTNGKDFCPYLKDFKCTIYEYRPMVCKTYPLSPNLDNRIYIDTNCPEVSLENKNKTLIIKNNKLTKAYKNNIFSTYQEKYIEMHEKLEELDKTSFEKILTINNQEFYQYVGNVDNNFIELHKLSLKNLANLF